MKSLGYKVRGTVFWKSQFRNWSLSVWKTILMDLFGDLNKYFVEEPQTSITWNGHSNELSKKCKPMNGNNTTHQLLVLWSKQCCSVWVYHVSVLKHLRMSRTKVYIWSLKCYDDESDVVPRYEEQDKGLDATRSGWVEFNKESLSSNNSHNLCPTFRLWLICT